MIFSNGLTMITKWSKSSKRIFPKGKLQDMAQIRYCALTQTEEPFLGLIAKCIKLEAAHRLAAYEIVAYLLSIQLDHNLPARVTHVLTVSGVCHEENRERL
jgi:hypothetical protein